MNLDSSATYALISVAHVAEHGQDGLVLASEIARQYEIPKAYLLKILNQLCRANILMSKRGPGGGFVLARPAKDISLLEVIEAVNGPISSSLFPENTEDPLIPRLEQVCRKASEKTTATLAKAKLGAMLKQ